VWVHHHSFLQKVYSIGLNVVKSGCFWAEVYNWRIILYTRVVCRNLGF